MQYSINVKMEDVRYRLDSQKQNERTEQNAPHKLSQDPITFPKLPFLVSNINSNRIKAATLKVC